MLSPLGASIAGLALALGGTAAAAFTGVLPAPAQNLAHTVIGAPAATTSQLSTATSSPSESSSHTGTPTDRTSNTGPVGPDASGPAALGLCTAWTQHESNGASSNGKSDDSAAFKNLAAAAGGADKIAAYCAGILQSARPTAPDASSTGPETSSSHPTGKPSTKPTQASTGHPIGTPSTRTTRP